MNTIDSVKYAVKIIEGKKYLMLNYNARIFTQPHQI